MEKIKKYKKPTVEIRYNNYTEYFDIDKIIKELEKNIPSDLEYFKENDTTNWDFCDCEAKYDYKVGYMERTFVFDALNFFYRDNFESISDIDKFTVHEIVQGVLDNFEKMKDYLQQVFEIECHNRRCDSDGFKHYYGICNFVAEKEFDLTISITVNGKITDEYTWNYDIIVGCKDEEDIEDNKDYYSDSTDYGW